MLIAETIREEMTTAWKAGDTRRRNTLRLLMAAFEYARIEARHTLSDDEALRVLQREAKLRRDAIEEFRKGKREDLVATEEQELEVISAYLPQDLSDDELRDLVRETIAEVAAGGPSDLGRVMGPLMQRVAGRADGRRANELVRELLVSG